MTKQKTTSTVESLINWANVSKFLTNGKDRIRKNRIPKIHEAKIEQLFMLLQAWKDDKKLFSEVDLINSLNKIDLKTNIMDEIGLVSR